jgi:hypothetical protein
MEPYKLRRWKANSSSMSGQFFTCARPGRSKGASGRVPDDLVHRWVQGLPGTDNTAIVSLLGRKHGPEGLSEFSFYSFCGDFDLPSERRGRVSWQEWLNRWHKNRCIQVLEYPTYDFRPIPQETLAAVASDISELLSTGRTVVLVDSGGETRTKVVCKHMGFIEDSSRTP